MDLRIVAAVGCLAWVSSAAAELPPIGVSLVKDINAAHTATPSMPDAFFVARGNAYFSAVTDVGRELFVSDGSAAGTRLLADLLPGIRSSDPLSLGVAGDRLILQAGEFVDRRIWSVPLQGGAAQPLTAEPRPAGEPATWIHAVAQTDARLLFQYGDDPAVWSTDGTTAGTARLPVGADFPIMKAWSSCAGANEAIVAGAGSGSTAYIAATDGTAGGARLLATVPAVGNAQAARLGNFCYLLLSSFSGGWALWVSDGTVAGTRSLLANAAHGLGIAAYGDSIYVSERNYAQNTARLLRLSAAAPAPQLVAEFSGSDAAIFGMLDVDGRLLFFSRASGQTILHVSDGTGAGTHPLFPTQPGQQLTGTSLYPMPGGVIVGVPGGYRRVDLATGATAPGPDSDVFTISGSVRLGAVRLGRGYSQESGEELWRSDGTPTGTYLLKDLWAPTTDGIVPGSLGTLPLVDGVLVFAAADPTPQWSMRAGIWRSDGTSAGTYPLPRAAYDDGSAHSLTRLRDGLLFASGSPEQGFSIYRTDTALASAVPVLGGLSGWVRMQAFAGGDKALFTCSPLVPSTVLCSLSAAGVVPAAPTGVDLSGFTPLGTIGGVALLQRDYEPGIWRSDGTVPGTFLVSSRSVSSSWAHAEFGGRRYFAACSAGNCELTATDGTAAGTVAVANLAGRELRAIAALPTRLVFTTRQGAGTELWSSDGSTAGTQPIAASGAYVSSSIAVAGGNAHVLLLCAGCGSGYVVSDGTSAGTRSMPVPDGQIELVPSPVMAAIGNTAVVFSCTSPTRGAELCAADANGADARNLPEIAPGDRSGSMTQVLAEGPQGIFLAADDGVHGSELWFVRPLPERIFAADFESL